MSASMSGARTRAVAFAPASVANVAVGFDLLGFSVDFTGDTVTVERTDSPEVTIGQVSGVVKSIPSDPAKNTATAGLVRLISELKLPFGFRVSIEKGIPLGSGMGGSAASAVGAIVAANSLLERPLSDQELMGYALIGEAQASGSYHADNIAPCFLGGLTLAQVRDAVDGKAPKVEATSIPLPQGVHCVLIHPHLAISTKEARGILRAELRLKDHIAQSANLAGFIAGCYRDDLELLQRSLVDLIIEPQRAYLIPGFADAKAAALSSGALGCSISGAGPSVFAWAANAKTAQEVHAAMTAAFRGAGVEVDGWSVPLNTEGARVIA